MAEGSKQYHIAVAEDDLFYRNIYRTKLTKEGYEVTVNANGEDLLKTVREEKTDLILLDLIMPKKNGFETLEELKQDDELKDIPVIVLSNLGQPSDIERAEQYGVEDFIVKSNFSIHDVLDKIELYTSGEKDS